MAGAEFTTRALVLHSRPLSDTKKILVLFSPDYGRFSAVLRGAKRQEKALSFTEYHCVANGRGDLKTLTRMEAVQRGITLTGTGLFCGMYVNELLVRLLKEGDASESLYAFYLETLHKLQASEQQKELLEICLRRFEFQFLNVLGVGLDLAQCEDGTRISEGDERYVFEPDIGFKPALIPLHASEEKACFTGTQIVALREEAWSDEVLRAAKRLSRLALAPWLGNQPLRARELFR